MVRRIKIGDTAPNVPPDSQTETARETSKPRYVPSGSNTQYIPGLGRDFSADRKKPFKNEPNTLHIFTDGSCHPNPGPGGWGVKLMWNGHVKRLYGGCAGQTNNTMELTAVLKGLQARTKDYPTIVYVDSQYAINCVTAWWRGWQRNGWVTNGGTPVKNRELIEAIVPLITPRVHLRWVKGHAGHEHNEDVDRLALRGRLEFGQRPEGGENVERTDPQQTGAAEQQPDQGANDADGDARRVGRVNYRADRNG